MAQTKPQYYLQDLATGKFEPMTKFERDTLEANKKEKVVRYLYPEVHPETGTVTQIQYEVNMTTMMLKSVGGRWSGIERRVLRLPDHDSHTLLSPYADANVGPHHED